MLLEADAAVLIGDAALRATYDAPRRGLDVYDLGQVWREWTGLPMVFAVWAARRDYAEANPGLVKDVHTRFVAQPRRGACPRRRGRRAGRRAGRSSTPQTLATYFRTLDFSLGARQVDGLVEFSRRRPRPVASTPEAPVFAAVARYAAVSNASPWLVTSRASRRGPRAIAAGWRSRAR